MRATTYNLTFTRGDDVVVTVRMRENLYDPFTQTYTPGDYIDLTGWTGRCQFRPTPDDPTHVDAVVTIDPDQTTKKGQFTFALTETQSRQVITGWGYDLELNDPATMKKTYIKGTVTVDLDYSHD